jgi:hypothetical protein
MRGPCAPFSMGSSQVFAGAGSGPLMDDEGLNALQSPAAVPAKAAPAAPKQQSRAEIAAKGKVEA